MTQIINNYARVLYDRLIPRGQVVNTFAILSENPALSEILKKPLISLREKEKVIDRVFPQQIRSFLKVVCIHDRAKDLPAIYQAYEAYDREKNGVLSARLIYVTPPSDSQLEDFKKFLCREYGKNEVVFDLEEDSSLIGGFILQAENYEYDYSLKGRYMRLEQKLTGR